MNHLDDIQIPQIHLWITQNHPPEPTNPEDIQILKTAKYNMLSKRLFTPTIFKIHGKYYLDYIELTPHQIARQIAIHKWKT